MKTKFANQFFLIILAIFFYSCDKKEDVAVGTGIVVLEGKEMPVKYGRLFYISDESYNGYLFGFSSYYRNNNDNIIADSQNPIINCIVHLETNPDQTLNSGDTWHISKDMYRVEYDLYTDEPLSDTYDHGYCYEPTDELLIKRIDDVYYVSIQNIPFTCYSYVNGEQTSKKMVSGSLSWNGNLKLEEW